MIEGIEALCGWMEIHQCAFWKIYYHTKGSQFLASNETTNDIGQAIQKLRSAFEKFAEGRYIIVCREELESNKQKGLAETIFIHTKQPSVNGVQSLQPVTPSYSEDQIQKRIDEALEKLTTKQKIEALEKENIELKREIKSIQPTLLQNRFASILPTLQQYLPGILEKMGIAKAGTNIAVSGVEEVENAVPPSVTDEQSRLINALEMWSEADPNYIDLIEKLANFAQNKPDQYKSYLPMIDSFLN